MEVATRIGVQTGRSDQRKSRPTPAPTIHPRSPSPPAKPAKVTMVMRESFDVLLIDAANVVGSRPTGWWRDRAKAADQFVARVRAAGAASKLGSPVVVVLEGVARQGVEEGVSDGVVIVHAPGHGDDTLVALAEAASQPVVLVSADRALGDRCRAVGADVVGPNWLLDRLMP